MQNDESLLCVRYVLLVRNPVIINDLRCILYAQTYDYRTILRLECYEWDQNSRATVNSWRLNKI